MVRCCCCPARTRVRWCSAREGGGEGEAAVAPAVADKVVHVFGRGRATLRTVDGNVLTSSATAGTVAGLIIRRDAGGGNFYGVWIRSGRLRLQDCDITSASLACVSISDGADPEIISCQ